MRLGSYLATIVSLGDDFFTPTSSSVLDADQLTGDEAMLWAILIADETDDLPDSMREFGGYYEGFNTYGEAQSVATALTNSDRDDLAGISMGFDATSEGEITGYSVNLYVPSIDTYLTKSWDVKQITSDRTAIGERAALAYATSLYADALNLRAVATQAGLV